MSIMTDPKTIAGDRLKEIIQRAVTALLHNDQKAAWQALDVDGFAAIREWERQHGRPVLTDEELAAAAKHWVDLAEANRR